MESSGPRRPSLLRSAPALVLFAIVIADAMRSADTDLWGHIYFGSIAVSKHQFLFAAPGSYALPAGSVRWPNLGWLGSVMLALIYYSAGVVGLKLAKLSIVAAIMLLIWRGEAESGASIEIQGLVLLGAALAFVPQMQFRPVLATYLFFAALMAMLAREAYGRRAPLWVTVPMLGLWANVHGGFFIGLMAMGLYTTVRGVQELAEHRGMRNTVRLGTLTSTAALATLVNPYGINDWLMIVSYLRNPFTLAHISEFRPLLAVAADFYRTGRPLFTIISAVAIMLGMVVTFALTPRADDLALFAIAILMSCAALYAVRNTALAVIACSVPLCRHAHLLAFDRLRYSPAARPARAPLSWRTLQIAIALAAVTLALRTGLFSKTLPVVEPKPVGALAFMQSHNLHGNVLCEFGWADYLIFHDPTHVRIFIESIFEAYYPHRVQDDFARFYYGGPGAARVLDAYPNDFVLMPTGSGAYAVMMAQNAWRLLYRDPVASLFAPAASPAARIGGVPQLVAAAPPSTFP